MQKKKRGKWFWNKNSNPSIMKERRFERKKLEGINEKRRKKEFGL